MMIVPALLALAIALLVTILVVFAMRQDPPQVPDDPPLTPVPPIEWLQTQYQSTTSLYIEVDREIWQISTIFMTASLLLMGWVVTNLRSMDPVLAVVLGCASIVLVGIATLFKHRLREFNLVHLGYLRRLELAVAQDQKAAAAEFWGLHYLRRTRLKSKGRLSVVVRSVHGVMDMYYFLFIGFWLALWFLAFAIARASAGVCL